MHGRTVRRRWVPAGLPQLTGSRWWVFLAVWSLALTVSAAATVAVMPTIVRAAIAGVQGPELVGLQVDDRAPWATLGPPAGRDAVAAGLRRGERLVAVNGQPVAATPEALSRQLRGAIGAPVTVTVVSRGGLRADHVLTRNPAAYREALAAVGLSTIAMGLPPAIEFFASTFLLLGCAVVLMVRRARDPLAPWASLMMLLVTFAYGETGQWVVGFFADPLAARYFFNAVAFALLMIVFAVFPIGRFEPRWSFPVAIGGALGAILSQPLPSAESNIIALVSQLAGVAAIASRYRRMSPGTGRQQIRWALFGFVASLMALAGFLSLQFVRRGVTDFGALAWIEVAMPLLLACFNSVLMVGITIALLRYRLYAADAAISRSVIYGAVTLSLLAIFAGSEKVIESLGERFLGGSLGGLAGALGAAVAAVMIVPVHHRVSHWAERRFRSGLAQLRHGMPLLVGDLRETVGPRALAQALLLRVETGVRARHAAVLMDGAVLDTRDVDPAAVRAWLATGALPTACPGGLERDRADPLFPLRLPLEAVGVGAVGWLLLGPRPDGTLYGREDCAALRDIADPVARALAVAGAREKREAARDNEIGSLRLALHRLQQRLGSGVTGDEAIA